MTNTIYTETKRGSKLTNEIVDERLNGRQIRRITNYINAITNIVWKCDICSHEWQATPNNVLNHNSGCPACANNTLATDENIASQLVIKHIMLIGTYVNAQSNTQFQCEVCKHAWAAKTSSILNGGNGCPKCANKLRLTNSTVDERLQGRTIKRIGDVITTHTKIEFECQKCACTWLASPNNVLNYNKTGCPKCGRNISNSEIQWLDLIGVPRESKYRQVQLTIGNNTLKVDGYISETNTVYEFWGDYWHGNPAKFNANDINKRAKKTYGELYKDTTRKRQIIIDAGYNLIEIWESSWKQMVKNAKINS